MARACQVHACDQFVDAVHLPPCGVVRVAPRAFEIAAGQANKGGRTTSEEAFALDGRPHLHHIQCAISDEESAFGLLCIHDATPFEETGKSLPYVRAVYV